MSETKERRTLYILYVLGFYILLQAGWWAYHLIDLNRELYTIKGLMLNTDMSPVIRMKIWMILGEGFIFFCLLAFGFYQIKSNVSKELRLAKKEKQFLLSVTHELKTPIAAVKLFLETLKTRKLEPAQELKIMEDALKENSRLQALSENILLATHLDERSNPLYKEKTDLTELLRQIILRYQNLFPDYIINSDIEKGVVLDADRQFMQALIGNLIENAVKYSPEKLPIRVTLHTTAHQAVLRVEDSGIGIAMSERNRIFDKFYRVGNEETRKTKGTGLGLYIVKNAVKLHGGSIETTDNVPKGSVFTVKLPLSL